MLLAILHLQDTESDTLSEAFDRAEQEKEK
jgi:hypothetical protein